TQASRKTTTSYSYAKKVSAEAKKTFGIPKISEISVTLKAAATVKHENTVADTYNTNQGQSFKLTAQTVFDDLVAATASQLNIYSYPVIGKCVEAPDSKAADGCPAGKAPLQAQFSGPDNVWYLELVEGRSLEWYQPVQEPGNIFSYPGSLS